MPAMMSCMWVDDLAVPVVSLASSLLRKGRNAFVCVHDAFLEVWLGVEFAARKDNVAAVIFWTSQ